MSLERTLRDIVDGGDEHYPIAQINCPPTFNLQTATTTRETLWRLAGYGALLLLLLLLLLYNKLREKDK